MKEGVAKELVDGSQRSRGDGSRGLGRADNLQEWVQQDESI